MVGIHVHGDASKPNQLLELTLRTRSTADIIQSSNNL